MQSHTSIDIANAIMTRAERNGQTLAQHLAPKYPQAVELAPEECQGCGGEGSYERVTGGWELPRYAREKCPTCAGAGSVPMWCEICGDSRATTETFDGAPSSHLLCERCATDWRECEPGNDQAVAFALSVLS